MKNYQLPAFSMNDYSNMLNQLIEVGYLFKTVSLMRNDSGERVVFLRHDVDLHISLISEMAYIDKSFGICATYFVPLTLHFNPLYPPNQSILRQLVEMGHEIGLHYDMETYPCDPEEARQHLDWEAGILSKVVGRPVRTICMHNPHKGQSDPYRVIDEYVHPHDPRYQKDLLYVSDSCRAWRDESLLTCFGPNPPRRLLLLIHPELWLGGHVRDRIECLETVLTARTLRQHQDYLEYVRDVWLNHPATHAHDKRERER